MRTKPTLLIATDDLYAGGMERQIVELLKGLKRRDQFRLLLAVIDNGGQREEEAKQYVDDVINIGRKARFDGTPALGLIHGVYRNKVDLIHTFGWMSSLSGLLAARILKLPLVNGSVRSAPDKLGVRDRISRWAALKADVRVANSYAGLQAFHLDTYPKSLVIYNGVDLSRFEVNESLESIRPFRICMVANFSIFKDHVTAIKAFAEVTKTIPNSKLVLVGNEAGKLNEALQVAQDTGVLDSIEIIQNCIHPEPIIQNSDVCLLTSFTEGISNSIIEYMALGKPVIATNCAGNSELIQQDITGFLVSQGDYHETAQKIINLYENPAQAQTMGACGREIIFEKFALDRMIDEYVEVYYSLISDKFQPMVDLKDYEKVNIARNF